jgi:hypothetical protein
LPLSTVDVSEVCIDGWVIDMADRVDKAWFVLDSAYVDAVALSAPPKSYIT